MADGIRPSIKKGTSTFRADIDRDGLEDVNEAFCGISRTGLREILFTEASRLRGHKKNYDDKTVALGYFN